MTGERRLPTGLLLRLFHLAVFTAIAVPVVKDWPTVSRYLRWDHAPYLIFSALFLAAGIFWTAFAWQRVAFAQGVRLPFISSLELYTSAGLAARLPGQIWPVLTALSFARGASLQGGQVVGMLLYSQVYLVLSGGIFLSVLIATGAALPAELPGWGAGTAAWASLSFFSLAALHPRLLKPLLSWFFRRIGRPAEAVPPAVSFSASMMQLAYYQVGWFLCACSFLLFMQGVAGPLEKERWPPVMAVFCAAQLGGMLSLFTPQGLGVREGILTLLLSRILPLPVAGAGALLARFWTSGGMALIYLFARRPRSSRSIAAAPGCLFPSGNPPPPPGRKASPRSRPR